jgi:hypothetical protein
MKTEYQYLVFTKADKQPGKTEVWECRSKNGGTILGIVKWFCGWRQYCYFDECAAVYSTGCLRDVADFMQQLATTRS